MLMSTIAVTIGVAVADESVTVNAVELYHVNHDVSGIWNDPAYLVVSCAQATTHHDARMIGRNIGTSL